MFHETILKLRYPSGHQLIEPGSFVKEGLFRGRTPQALMLLIRKAVDEENLGPRAMRFGKHVFFLCSFGCLVVVTLSDTYM